MLQEWSRFSSVTVAVVLLSAMSWSQNAIPKSKVPQFLPPVRTAQKGPVQNVRKPPTYCKPCLFYGGDLDLTNSAADTFANENIIPGGSPLISQIYSPFRIPKGQTWLVTGLLINSIAYPTALDPANTPWEIRTSIPIGGGTGGKLIAHGSTIATMKPTGRSVNGTPEYTILLRWKKPIVLKGGTKTGKNYWENLTPQCTNPNNSQCTAQGFTGFLESDMETQGGFNGYGPPEPWDNSFWNAPAFGLTWANIYQVHLQRGFPGGDAMSAGVIGKKQ